MTQINDTPGVGCSKVGQCYPTDSDIFKLPEELVNWSDPN